MLIMMPPPGLTAADFWCHKHGCEKWAYWPGLPTCPECDSEEITNRILDDLRKRLEKLRTAL